MQRVKKPFMPRRTTMPWLVTSYVNEKGRLISKEESYPERDLLEIRDELASKGFKANTHIRNFVRRGEHYERWSDYTGDGPGCDVEMLIISWDY